MANNAPGYIYMKIKILVIMNFDSMVEEVEIPNIHQQMDQRLN